MVLPFILSKKNSSLFWLAAINLFLKILKLDLKGTFKFSPSNNDLKPLIDLVGKWRYFIGIKEELSKEELFMNINFIRENFNELKAKINRDKLGINLSAAKRKTEIDAKKSFDWIEFSDLK